MPNEILGSSVTPKTVIAVGAVLPGLASIAVGLRFYVRIKRSNTVQIDDYLILLALILTVGLGIAMIVGAAVHALAQPTPLGTGPLGFMFVLNDAIVITEKIKWPFNLLQILILGSIKLSVIFFYRRIFRGRVFDICSRLLIAIVSFWTFSFFFSILFECGIEFWALWSTLNDLLTHCMNDVMALKALTISDVITDGLILALPIPNVWKLQMSPKRKIAVCGVFLLGVLAVAAGTARLVIFIQKLNDSFSTSQGIMLITTWAYWTMIEMGLSIVAACLPTLRPLVSDGMPESWPSMLKSWLSLGPIFSWASSKVSFQSHDRDTDTTSHSSYGVFVPKSKKSKIATEIYPMVDVEAQSQVPASSIMIRSNFSQTSCTHEEPTRRKEYLAGFMHSRGGNAQDY